MNPESSQQPDRTPLITGIVAVAILALVVGGITLANKEDDPADKTATSSAVTNQQASDSAETDTTDSTAAGTYTSGEYTGSGSYTSPGGTEEVRVKLTLNGSTITNATVTTDPASPTSEQYQAEFKSGFKALVIGKDIDDVKLSKVSGSSLTSQGFNAALEQIKEQAQPA